MGNLRLGRMNCVFLNCKHYAKIPIIKIFNELSFISCKPICIKLENRKIKSLDASSCSLSSCWAWESLLASLDLGFLLGSWEFDGILCKVLAVPKIPDLLQCAHSFRGQSLTSAIILLVSPKKSRFSASSSVVAWWRDRFFRWMFWSGSSNIVTFLGNGKQQKRGTLKMKGTWSLFFIGLVFKRCRVWCLELIKIK